MAPNGRAINIARRRDRGLLSRVPRIALATYSKLPTLNDDDRLLVPALAALGVTAVPVWDPPRVCWDEFLGVLIRSLWDYHPRPLEFLGWDAQAAGRLARAIREEIA